jgi:hypothetical protein
MRAIMAAAWLSVQQVVNFATGHRMNPATATIATMDAASTISVYDITPNDQGASGQTARQLASCLGLLRVASPPPLLRSARW